MPWDQLTADQRRTVALQMDYQHDPEKEAERQYWWDHWLRQGELKAVIAQWETIAVPTAQDLARRETRLKQLRQELARSSAKEFHAGISNELQRAPSVVRTRTTPQANSSATTPKYVPYPKALSQLTLRLGASADELAAWIFMGQAHGGIDAYLHANELDSPPRFSYGRLVGVESDGHDYLSPLMACWFLEESLALFKPCTRYMTGAQLIGRWNPHPGLKAAAFIGAKIRESRLHDIHPICGLTQGSEPDNQAAPPLECALFYMSEVEAIEAEDFAVDWEPVPTSVEIPGSIFDLRGFAGTHDVVVTQEAPSEVKMGADEAHSGKYVETDKTDPCVAFRDLRDLAASELNIAFIGDRDDTGLAANSMLEISAREITKRVPLAAIGLLDRRTAGPNSQAAILLGMASGLRLTHSVANAAKMTRLREIFRRNFGLVSDPFETYRKNEGWVPHFVVVDRRGRADERAKREGERRTDSFEELIDRGAPFQEACDLDRSYDDLSDAAGTWLKQKDEDRSA